MLGTVELRRESKQKKQESFKVFVKMLLLLSKAIFISFYLSILLGLGLGYKDVEEFVVQMPGVHISHPDQYTTFAKRLLNNQSYFIVSFDPIAAMDVVHHMILSGCKHADEGVDAMHCVEKKLLYAWARNAPKLDLPNGVGFKVGKDTGIGYMYIEVHYANSSNDGGYDYSGVKLSLTKEKLFKEAGTLLLATGGRMRANSTEYFEVACTFTSNVDIHPFAFRTHTHTHGIVVSGYKVHRGFDNVDIWTLIGKKNPQLPQFFYPSENAVIRLGDKLAARCVMRNDDNHEITTGGSSKDEMCNFYIMFYKSGENGTIGGCFSAGPPLYYWKSDSSLNNIPMDASNE